MRCVDQLLVPQPVLDPSGLWTAQLEVEDNAWSDNAWFVAWIRISTEDADFNCPVGAWLQRGENFNSSVTSSCQQIESRNRREVGTSTEKSVDSNQTRTQKTVEEKSKDYVAIFTILGKEFRLNMESIVTFVLLQMPAVSLAFYGVFCALRQPEGEPKKKIMDKITDSLLALTIIILPYFVTELFTLLLQFEFTENGLGFLIKKVKGIWAPVINKISATFDLLKFLPDKDPNGRDRSA